RLGSLSNNLITIKKSNLNFLNSINQIANNIEIDIFNITINTANKEEANTL
ncbi:hypothetical protein EDB80DRAFT_573386, partial [Ilyonectria destructans]